MPRGPYRRKEFPMSSPAKFAQVEHALPRFHERQFQGIERADLIALGLWQGHAIWQAVTGLPTQGAGVSSALTVKPEDR